MPVEDTPSIKRLIERLRSAEEALKFYDKAGASSYSGYCLDSGDKARAHFENVKNE